VKWDRDARPHLRIALAVFAVAALYRFNGLGGTLGGFDGDHFLYYVRARQVVHGERTLRDFVDAGLQGAWPALTYELPALFQRWGGETLLSEAVLAVGAIAASLALLFLAAARLAGTWRALVVTTVTLLLGAKLYAYPKLLVFSVAVVLLVRYARRPTVGHVVLFALWSAIAFLFRHDFLVYLAPALAVLVVALGWSAWRETGKRLLVYGGVVMLLLAGPLFSIGHYVGLGPYVRASLALSQSEALRTDISWPRFVPAGGVREFFSKEENAEAWLYYLCLAIPVLALLRLRSAPAPANVSVSQARAVILSLVVLALLLNWFFLRGNLGARFGDLGAPIAVLAAWVMTTGTGARRHVRVITRVITAMLVAATVLAADTVGSVTHELDTTGFSDSIWKIGRRVVAVTTELGSMPPPPVGDPSAGIPALAEYLRACTRPQDRVLLVASAPQDLAMATRAFAAGHPTFTPGFYTSPEEQQQMLRRLRSQSVPVVVTARETTYLEDVAPEFPLIHDYVTTFYEPVGELEGLAGDAMRILVRRGHSTTGVYGATGLPCFD
jgi:hypothetical protein